MEKELVGIIVGGGPAPGINGVISAATIEAINHGKKVVGIIGGFKSLFEGNKNAIIPLTIEDVSRINNTGGSILRTSRDRPDNAQAKFKVLLNTIKQTGINILLQLVEMERFIWPTGLSERHGGLSTSFTHQRPLTMIFLSPEVFPPSGTRQPGMSA